MSSFRDDFIAALTTLMRFNLIQPFYYEKAVHAHFHLWYGGIFVEPRSN